MVATLSKIEQAKADLCGLDLAPRLGDLAAKGWESLDEADLTIRLKWLGIFFRPVTPGRFMVRLRLPNGVICSDQLEVLADAVDRCGDQGSADITTRQNLQLRGLLLDDMAPLMQAMEEVGLTSRQSDLSLRHGKTSHRIHHKQHIFALIPKIFGDRRSDVGSSHPQKGTLITCHTNNHRASHTIGPQIVLNKLPNFSPLPAV